MKANSHYRKLIQDTRRIAQERGHELSNMYALSHMLWTASCKNGCGTGVMIGGEPEVDWVGEAVERCTGRRK